jgi:aspartyl-tRNA(Asn)/glutamyl-tRNA(Gln) amidotransferase subunit C
MPDKITREEVRHVARLARLEFSEEQEERLTGEMNSILAYMEKLNELDTTGLPSMSHAIRLQNVFRSDTVQTSLDLDKSLANAPASDGINFVVPKVI